MSSDASATPLSAGNIREYCVAFIEAGKALAVWVFLLVMAADNLFTEPVTSIFWWVSLACLPFLATQALGMGAAIRLAWQWVRRRGSPA